MFFASVISLGGDWFLWVAINGLIYEATGKALYVGLAILAQEFAFFLASPIGGVLADRVDRRKLMIVCDLARAIICVAFLLVGRDTIWLAYVLLPLLASFAAPFDPAFSAATPNVVEPEDLPAANALNGSLWGTMLAVGAGLGGIISAEFGAHTAFIVNAVSFVVSAALLSSIRRSFSEARKETTEHPSAIEATRETWRFARRDHRVLSLLAVKFGFGAAAGLLALIPVMALDVFDSGNVGFGILMAARGVGALIGPFLGHRIAGPGHRRLFPAIGLSLAVFGLGYMALGAAPSLAIAAVTICVAHLGGGIPVDAVHLRPAGARARPHPRPHLRLRLHADHALALGVRGCCLRGGRSDRSADHGDHPGRRRARVGGGVVRAQPRRSQDGTRGMRGTRYRRRVGTGSFDQLSA